jgi:transcriptional activator of glycolytic enzymes GCR1
VGQVWQEWKEGFGGNPAVKKLEKDWEARWRSDARMRKWFSRRKVIWDRPREIVAAGDAGRQLEDPQRKVAEPVGQPASATEGPASGLTILRSLVRLGRFFFLPLVFFPPIYLSVYM